MPTLRLTWTRSDVNNPWPAAEGLSTNVIAESNAAALARQFISDYQLTQTVTESENGLTRVVDYSGTDTDIQDFVAAVEPHLNSNFDNTSSVFGINLDINLLAD